MPYIGKSPTQAVRQKYQYTATASQTTFSGSDANSLTLAYTDENYIDVTQNGVMLKGGGNDYTATTGTSVVLATGATANDVIEIIVYDVFAVADHVKKSGDSMTGALSITTDDNNPQLTLKTTDADASSGPLLDLTRDSASPADGDVTGIIRFRADNDAGEVTTTGQIVSLLNDASDGTEDGEIKIETIVAGSAQPRIDILPGETVLNEGSIDVDFRVESNGNANMLVVDAGNDKLGIGTSSPSTELHLSTSTQGDIVTFESTDAGAATGPNLLLYRNSSSPADDDNIGAIRFRGRNDNSQDVDYAEIESLIVDASDGTENGALAFKSMTNGTNAEAMRIDGDGTLLIGRTVDVSAETHLGIEVTDATKGMVTETGQSGNTSHQLFINPNGIIGSIKTNGSATSFNTSSDYRLKENIVTDWDATIRLKQLKPSRFNFKADKDTTLDGFIAHEVSSVVPEAISGEKDAVDKDGNIEPQSIDQSKLVPLLTKALQESIARADALEARIKKLEDG